MRLRLLALLPVFLLLSACRGDRAAYVSELTGLDLPRPLSVTETDSHGGFHGDGKLAVKLTFDPAEAEDLTAQAREAGWTSTAHLVAGELVRTAYDWAVQDEAAAFPQTGEGWLWFRDRGSRPGWAYNYSLALWDSEGATLYYLELDT